MLAVTARAGAQIDNRVNVGNASSAGRLLDNNPQIGSGGYNITRPGMNNPGAMADAIVTGNVTGLAGFKGVGAIPANNVFRDSLPSAGLSNFQSRSVGLRDVLSGNPLQTGYFFGKPETIADLGYIRAGLNQPGSSTIESTSLAPFSASTVTDYQSSLLLRDMRSPEDRRVNISQPNLRPGDTRLDTGFRMTPVGGRMDGRSSTSTQSPYRDAMSSSIFGAPPPPSRTVGGRTTGLASMPTVSTAPGSLPIDDLLPPRTRVSEDPERLRIDASVTSLPQDPLTSPIGLERPFDPDSGTRPTDRPGLEDLAEAPVQVTLGDDRFADLYSAVGMAQSLGVSRLGFELDASPRAGELSETTPDATTPSVDIAESQVGGLVRRPSESLRQLASSAKWASDVLEHPLTTFAGQYQSELNLYMRRGEEALHEGQYYNAARLFEMASTIDPINPLPLLARGHALAAAGDYRSAVRFLLQGIERFPQVAAFRLDLPSLIGRPDVFDIRRADLESKLAHAESPELRFLLGYLELYSGLPEEGIQNLRMAAQASDPDSIIGMFVDLVTGQRELPPISP